MTGRTGSVPVGREGADGGQAIVHEERCSAKAGGVVRACRKRAAHADDLVEKRFKKTHDGVVSSNNQTPLPLVLTQSSLGPMRVIKPTGTSTKESDAEFYSSGTTQLGSAELPMTHPHGLLGFCENYNGEVDNQGLHNNSAVSSLDTAVGDGSYRFTETQWSATIKGTNSDGNTFPNSTFLYCGHNGNPSPLGIDTIYQDRSGNNQSDRDDDYPLDDGIADDNLIQLLANAPGSISENHIPPSSVQEWHCKSHSPIDFDPTLQYTPPGQQVADSEAARGGSGSPAKQDDGLEDLLDEDVDWSAVLIEANSLQNNSSTNLHHLEGTPSQAPRTKMRAEQKKGTAFQEDQAEPLAMFVRPPFPEAIRDRPFVPGMSSETLLRTCFRVGVMIDQTARCFNHQQDVVFQLYARVTYSSRETQIRRQHFQFVDLFKDVNPYPSGVLSGWRAGSQLDTDSAAFLDTRGGPRRCWCICKPVRDKTKSLGWTFNILKIREVNWDEIRWAKMIVCEYSGEQESAAPGGQ